MPVYELSVVLRILPRADIAATLKRVGCLLIEKGAKLQKIENLGTRDLPYRFLVKDVTHDKGSYFVYSFHANANIFPDVVDACTRDVDIIKHHINPAVPAELPPGGCTLDEEMRPPATRKSVLDLLEKSKTHRERTKPFYWHVKEYNYDDNYK